MFRELYDGINCVLEVVKSVSYNSKMAEGLEVGSVGW